MSGFSKAGLSEENREFGIGVSTSREMVRLLELIANGKVVSPDSENSPALMLIAGVARELYEMLKD